jgi:hypothetical protein
VESEVESCALSDMIEFSHVCYESILNTMIDTFRMAHSMMPRLPVQKLGHSLRLYVKLRLLSLPTLVWMR